MGAQLGTGGGAISDINMTPLIDIVLVVLIIMMVNIPIQIEEMGLKLPSPLPPPPPDIPVEQLVIAIYKPEAEGEEPKIALNRRIMNEQEMLYEITRRLRPMVTKNVFIDADKAVPYGRVVDMVDLGRSAGAANVGLAKMKDEGPLPALEVSKGANMPRGALIGSPQVRGEITEKIADASIQPLKGSIEQCYLQALTRKADLTGNYIIYLELGPQGEHLKPPAIETDAVGDPEMKACVELILPNLAYRPLGDQKTAWIRYPILFSPGQ